MGLGPDGIVLTELNLYESTADINFTVDYDVKQAKLAIEATYTKSFDPLIHASAHYSTSTYRSKGITTGLSD
jgi:hypothetical protein